MLAQGGTSLARVVELVGVIGRCPLDGGAPLTAGRAWFAEDRLGSCLWSLDIDQHLAEACLLDGLVGLGDLMKREAKCPGWGEHALVEGG